MKVFLSSVRTELEEERDSVTGLLRAVGHTVIRFEDFGAVDATSRVACLEALSAADCYMLLLGPRYGSPIPDTRLSPTEEEFNTARSCGIPRLVFKKAGVEVEPAQAEFCDRVGSYPGGRFWGEFIGIGDLLPGVISAVQTLRERTEPVTWRPALGFVVAPIHEERKRRAGWTLVPTGSAILEVHVVPERPVALRLTAASQALQAQVIASMRATGFVEPGAPVEAVRDRGSVHMVRPSVRARANVGVAGVTMDPYRGIRLGIDGTSAAYMTLPGDLLGSLTDSPDLIRRVHVLLDQVIPFVPRDAGLVAPIACLMDEGRTALGNPGDVGTRSSGTLGYGRSDIVLPADRTVDRTDLVARPHEVATEVAARLHDALRDRY